MQLGDPFVCHTSYCLQVLTGVRTGDFNEFGHWPTQEPAVVDEPSQEVLLGQLRRWKDLVRKYNALGKGADPRELFILAVAVQRWPGPVLEIGTHKGVSTCLMCEVMNNLRRPDQLFTVELFLESHRNARGEQDYPGDAFLKALQNFRAQAPLNRIVSIVGDSSQLKPLFFGIRPSVLFLDGDQSEKGVEEDLQLLRFLNYPFICLIRNANLSSVLRPVLNMRHETNLAFANFHTGSGDENGLAALARF